MWWVIRKLLWTQCVSVVWREHNGRVICRKNINTDSITHSTVDTVRLRLQASPKLQHKPGVSVVAGALGIGG